MKQQIKERKIYKVKEWNIKHKGTILAYTLGNGSMIDTPRSRGYVVQKRHIEGGESSKFHANYEKALSDFYQDNL